VVLIIDMIIIVIILVENSIEILKNFCFNEYEIKKLIRPIVTIQYGFKE